MTAVVFLTVEEVAATISMSPDYVRRQCDTGALKATKLGNRYRIAPSAVDDFMETGEAPAARKRDPKLSARQSRRSA